MKILYYIGICCGILLTVFLLIVIFLSANGGLIQPGPPPPKYQRAFGESFRSTSLSIDVKGIIISLWVEDSLQYALKYSNNLKKKELMDSLHIEYSKIFQNEHNRDSMNIIIYNNFLKKKNEIGFKLDTMITYPIIRKK